jgi:thioredoxin 1
MLLERLLILAVVVGFSLLCICIWRGCQAWRLRKLAEARLPEEVTAIVPAGPALLYFTTDDCAQCRFQQKPILTQLAKATQAPIYTFDAVTQEQLARFFGVMTVPTTVWLDHNRRPAAINHGLATLPQLRQQAVEIGVA